MRRKLEKIVRPLHPGSKKMLRVLGDKSLRQIEASGGDHDNPYNMPRLQVGGTIDNDSPFNLPK